MPQRLSVDFLLILLKNLNFEKTKNVKFFVFDSDELKCKEFERHSNLAQRQVRKDGQRTEEGIHFIFPEYFLRILLER
jgi:hypothetical protein